jgi:hypothetical protein
MTLLALEGEIEDAPEEMIEVSNRQEYYNRLMMKETNPSWIGRQQAKIEYFFVVKCNRFCRRRIRGYNWFWRVWCGTKSCFCFAYDGRNRERAGWLIKHPRFEAFILICIAISSVFMVFNSPLGNPAEICGLWPIPQNIEDFLSYQTSLRNVFYEWTCMPYRAFYYFDVLFALIFTVEMVLKMVAMGIFTNNNQVADGTIKEDRSHIGTGMFASSEVMLNERKKKMKLANRKKQHGSSDASDSDLDEALSGSVLSSRRGSVENNNRDPNAVNLGDTASDDDYR